MSQTSEKLFVADAKQNSSNNNMISCRLAPLILKILAAHRPLAADCNENPVSAIAIVGAEHQSGEVVENFFQTGAMSATAAARTGQLADQIPN